jgi:hypothetical protein
MKRLIDLLCLLSSLRDVEPGLFRRFRILKFFASSGESLAVWGLHEANKLKLFMVSEDNTFALKGCIAALTSGLTLPWGLRNFLR